MIPYMKLALALTITGFVCHFFGFITPFWYGDGYYNTGLWMKCEPEEGIHSYYTTCHAYLSPTAGIMVARIFQTLVFLGYIGLCVTIGLYLTKELYRDLMASLIGCWLVVLFTLSGLIAWGATEPYHINWSFILVGMSMFITSGAGAILIRERFYKIWVR